MSVVIRNWRSVKPVIAHGAGIDWRLLSMNRKTSGDIEAEVGSEYRCLKSITYVSLAWLQPGLSYEPHMHDDHEEVYYIIKGRGKIRVGNDVKEFRDGDAIYIPEGMVHEIINDSDEIIEFIAFGGYIKGDKGT